jgi:phage baseplate assembly protein W
MPGIAPKLPLQFSSSDGAYHSMKTLKETIQQNFKMLLLTSPGERVMIPEYGVGIRRFLFQNESEHHTRSQISTRISEQSATYMPFITIEDIIFSGEVDRHELFIRIEYSIRTLNQADVLELNLI